MQPFVVLFDVCSVKIAPLAWIRSMIIPKRQNLGIANPPVGSLRVATG